MWVASSLVPTCWQLPNIGIHCIMPLFVKVVIDLGFKGLSLEIMFTCNKQHQQLWMWLKDMLFYMWKVLPLGVLLLKGRDGQTWKDHVHNCVLCHLPNVDGQIDPSLAMIPIGLWCMSCGQYFGTTIMLICDQCSWGWHMGCFMPLVEEVLVGKLWFCFWCI
jgi:hypothetical protein